MDTLDNRIFFSVQRVSIFRDLLRDHKLDAYLLCDLPNSFYFTGFWNEGYFSLISQHASWLFLPSLLYDHAKAATFGFHCVKGKVFPNLDEILRKNRFKKVGFDPSAVSFDIGMQLKKRKFIPVPGLVSKLRLIKDDLEISLMRQANHLAVQGLNFLEKRFKPGVSERALSADLNRFYHHHGHGIAFNLIVAAGANSAFPHHITSDYKLKKGDAIICDVGAIWEGYRSDLTRTYPLGKMAPSFWRIFRIVEKAQKEAIHKLKPNVRAVSIDSAARQVIQKAGYGRSFVHNTGHGVGIDIHESPRLGPGSQDVLKAGMVVTVEPGIYLPGKFGVRIEDTLLITQSGHEVLTK